MCVESYVHMSINVPEAERVCWVPRELELQSAVSQPVLVLGTELGSSAKAYSLNYSVNLSSAWLRFFSSCVIRYFGLWL